MPVETTWGAKLTRSELKKRTETYERNCEAFEREVSERLRTMDARIEVEWIHPVCVDCPEPNPTCHECRVDADMSSHFVQSGIRVTIIPQDTG